MEASRNNRAKILAFRIAHLSLVLIVVSALLSVLLFTSCGMGHGEDSPSNIILFIGDGMGEAHAMAGSYFATGEATGLSFQQFPVRSSVTTRSADNPVTDSAAAATAMATGSKVNNGVLSVALPGDGKPLETILEQALKVGKRAGIVTTTTITHATPAAFASHQPSRTDGSSIAQDMLYGAKPDLLFGGGGEGMSFLLAKAAGYCIVIDREEMLNLVSGDLPVSGQFGESHLPYEIEGLGNLPHLSEMTQKAIDLLSQDPEGFFLVVEGGRIDHAAHGNDLPRMVAEVVELARSVDVALRWAEEHPSTLIVVTADHETGGLHIQSPGVKGQLPEVVWMTTGHTGVTVPLYAWGTGAHLFPAEMDNTEIHQIIKSFMVDMVE